MPAMDLNSQEVSRLQAKASSLTKPPMEGDLLIGQLCIMSSAAGWYLGRPCIECIKTRANFGCGDHHAEWFPQPYNRESDYFHQKEEAENYLRDHTNSGEWN